MARYVSYPSLSLISNTHLEVPDAVVDAGRKDLVLPAAPCLGDYLDDLLQGTAHSVEHGVFVDPCRLAVGVPQASLWKECEMSKFVSFSTLRAFF